MNPALISISSMRTMSNLDLIKSARQFDRLSILETELLKRLDVLEQEEIRKRERTLKFMARTKEDQEVRTIVDWAKAREVKQTETEQA